jgi:hypothetical protein
VLPRWPSFSPGPVAPLPLLVVPPVAAGTLGLDAPVVPVVPVVPVPDRSDDVAVGASPPVTAAEQPVITSPNVAASAAAVQRFDMVSLSRALLAHVAAAFNRRRRRRK